MGENESVNALATELLAEDCTCLLKAKRLGRSFGAADLTAPAHVARLAGHTDQFLRLELLQQAGQIRDICFGNQKLSGRQVQTGHADCVFLGQHGHQCSFPTLGFEQRPRRDNANNIARNDPFSFVGLLKLFTHRHLIALLDQPGEIRLQAIMRHPTHGDLFVAFSVRAGGQHDVQFTRRHCRIVKKHLVEVTETVEQQFLFVLFLNLPVLLHHVGCRVCGRWRRVRCILFGHCVCRSRSRSRLSTLPYVPALVVRVSVLLDFLSAESSAICHARNKNTELLGETALSVTYVTPVALYTLVTPPIVAAKIQY